MGFLISISQQRQRKKRFQVPLYHAKIHLIDQPLPLSGRFLKGLLMLSMKYAQIQSMSEDSIKGSPTEKVLDYQYCELQNFLRRFLILVAGLIIGNIAPFHVIST